MSAEPHTHLLHAEQCNHATIELLRIINATATKQDLIHQVTAFLKQWLQCDAIGVRLKEGDDFPYFETSGFPQKFVKAERSLCSYTKNGDILRDASGNAVLDCMCGNILCMRVDPSKPFFTPHGSFCSNGTTQLLATTTAEDRQARTRNRCNGEGYESVGLFPLRLGADTFGLLQVNDKREGLFTADTIALLEQFGDNLAIRLAHLRTEEELTGSEERYRLIVENTGDGILFANPEGEIYSANPEACRMLGRSEDEIKRVGRNGILDLTDTRLQHALAQRRKDGFFKGELNFLRVDGSPFPADITTRLFVDSQGNERTTIILRDMTERKRTEEALRQSVERHRTILQTAMDGFWLTDLEGHFLEVNEAYCRMSGYAEQELLTMRIADLDAEEKQSDILDHIRRIVATGEARFEAKHRRKDGTTFDVEVNVQYQRTGEGFFVVFVQDISERVKAEEKSTRLAAIVECSDDIIISKRLDGTVTSWNAGAERIYGYSEQEMLGMSVSILAHPDHIDELPMILDKIRRGEHINHFETIRRRKDGESIDVSLTISPIKNSAGKIIGASTIGRDITDRKRTEEALIESERFARSTLDGLFAHIAIVNETGVIEAVNKAWKDFAIANDVGWDKVSEGSNYLNVCRTAFGKDAQGSVEFAAEVDSVLAGSKELFEMEYPCHSPVEQRWFNVRVTRFPGEGRRRVVIAHENITTRKLAEENMRHLEMRLRQSEKMDAIGQLAGGIAHDFNNVLGGIIGYTDISLGYAEKGSMLEQNLTKVLTASDRAKNLVKQILTFSRQGNPQKSAIYIRPIIKEVLDMLRASIPSSVIIESEELQKDTRPVLADPTKIHEVMLNLANNAVHAMNRKGTLEIRLSSVTLAEARGSRSGVIQPGEYTVIEVSDTGCGMDEATLSKAFDPFFTTKAVGEGTGMGLSVVLGVVESHDGHIQVESRVGKGTTFRIYLPATHERTSQQAAEDNRLKLRGTERILFVDDENMLVEMALTMLVPLGYVVTGMMSSQAALMYLREHIADIDMLVTDQTMPEMTGIELAMEARKLKADLPIILCTGFSSEVNAAAAAAAGIGQVLMKPYGYHEISKAIRTAVDGKA